MYILYKVWVRVHSHVELRFVAEIPLVVYGPLPVKLFSSRKLYRVFVSVLGRFN